jgi:hypothetical protein
MAGLSPARGSGLQKARFTHPLRGTHITVILADSREASS